MKYCFIDESGVASCRDGRLFIVTIVIFDTLDEANSMREKIRDLKLRNNIPQDYEFHYSRNAKTKKELGYMWRSGQHLNGEKWLLG